MSPGCQYCLLHPVRASLEFVLKSCFNLCSRAASLLQSLVMLFGHLQASAADTGAAAGDGSAAELQAAEAVILQDLDMMLKHDADLGSVSFSSSHLLKHQLHPCQSGTSPKSPGQRIMPSWADRAQCFSCQL